MKLPLHGSSYALQYELTDQINYVIFGDVIFTIKRGCHFHRCIHKVFWACSSFLHETLRSLWGATCKCRPRPQRARVFEIYFVKAIRSVTDVMSAPSLFANPQQIFSIERKRFTLRLQTNKSHFKAHQLNKHNFTMRRQSEFRIKIETSEFLSRYDSDRTDGFMSEPESTSRSRLRQQQQQRLQQQHQQQHQQQQVIVETSLRI